MKKNICFISIFDLTMVQFEQATRLEARGCRCYWMTTSKLWTQWLLNRGVSSDNILQLVFEKKDFLEKELMRDVANEIVVAEFDSKITANLAVIADRFLMADEKNHINDYIVLYFFHIKNFLKNKSIEIVFGEPTNFNELIAMLVCEHLKILFAYPQDLRYPSRRFFFELGTASGEMISSGKGSAKKSGKEILEEFRNNKKHPQYFYIINKRKWDTQRIYSMCNNRFKSIFGKNKNFTHHDFIDRLTNGVLKIINKFYLEHICKYNDIANIEGKVAFFGLHVQPESSIDVVGPYFSDQLKLVKDFRRALPFDTALVIKEHPNFLGQKSIKFFRDLKNLPNVFIVHPKTSTFKIYKRASLVLTISGTIAYEAGMLGIPAIIFSRQFFKEFSSVHYCADVTQLKPLALHLLKGAHFDEIADAECMDMIIGRSYPGYWTDPYSDPSVMSTENLEALFVGFLDVVEGTCFHTEPLVES
jgi:hypothetical protein